MWVRLYRIPPTRKEAHHAPRIIQPLAATLLRRLFHLSRHPVRLSEMRYFLTPRTHPCEVVRRPVKASHAESAEFVPCTGKTPLTLLTLREDWFSGFGATLRYSRIAIT